MHHPLPDLLGMPMPALVAHLASIGVGAGHAGRVFSGVHRQQLPFEAIVGLGGHAARIRDSVCTSQVEVVDARRAEDTTEKLALRLGDGALIEAVLVPMPGGRTTLCVSSQVGCAMGCTFCATGTMGLVRNLSAGEIVGQVHAARAWARRDGREVHRLVFMGMGEPLHNWPAVHAALQVLLDPHGPGFGTKQITISTVGLPDRMQEFALAFGGRVQLALSLHAGTDQTRVRIVPMARRVPLSALRAIVETWPLPGKRALMVEYVVLPGVNDGEADLDGVAAFMQGVRGVVNLIPFNPFVGAGFRSPTPEEARAVQAGLQQRGVFATVRWPRGREAHGACGQLALRHQGSDP